MNYKNSLLGALTVLVLTTSSYAFALELGEAKNKGIVGESTTGYLEPINGNASSEVRSLISTINSKRKAKYVQISKKNRTTLAAVEALAGKKAIEKTSSGNYIKTSSGWKKK